MAACEATPDTRPSDTIAIREDSTTALMREALARVVAVEEFVYAGTGAFSGDSSSLLRANMAMGKRAIQRDGGVVVRGTIRKDQLRIFASTMDPASLQCGVYLGPDTLRYARDQKPGEVVCSPQVDGFR